jgi:HTH-type transcriptional regulator/antitoxin HigA
MASTDVQNAEHAWPRIEPVLFVPHTDQDYQRLVEVLDKLTDLVGEDEAHPLASMMEVIGVLIEKYEDEHVPEITSD